MAIVALNETTSKAMPAWSHEDPATTREEGLKPSSEEEGWQESRAREERWRQQMRAAQDGDKAAYETLLTDIMPLLRAVVQRTWRNPHDVEDIVQDVLLSLHQAGRRTRQRSRCYLKPFPEMLRRMSRKAATIRQPSGQRWRA